MTETIERVNELTKAATAAKSANGNDGGVWDCHAFELLTLLAAKWAEDLRVSLETHSEAEPFVEDANKEKVAEVVKMVKRPEILTLDLFLNADQGIEPVRVPTMVAVQAINLAEYLEDDMDGNLRNEEDLAEYVETHADVERLEEYAEEQVWNWAQSVYEEHREQAVIFVREMKYLKDSTCAAEGIWADIHEEYLSMLEADIEGAEETGLSETLELWEEQEEIFAE